MIKIKKIQSLFRDNVFRYSILSYLSQGLAFFNIYLLATYLSIFEFGVYSFITLMLSYFSYSTLGINYSFVNFLSIKSKKKRFSESLYQNSLIFTIIIFIVIYFISIIFLNLFPSFVTKYEIDKYFHFILFIAFLNNINNLFVKMYRVYNRLNKLIFNLLISPITLFTFILITSDKINLLDVLLIMITSRSLSLLCFFYKPALKFSFNLNLRLSKLLLYKGINLLFYNFSFGLISISALTVFSYLNNVEDFAIFKLSFTLSSISILLAAAFENLLYPKIFYKVVKLKGMELLNFLKTIKQTYVFSIVLLNSMLIFVSPFLNLIFPNYIGLHKFLFLFSIGNIFLIKTYPVRILLVSRGEENILTRFSLLSCIIVVLSSIICFYLNLNSHFYGFSYLLGSIFFYLISVHSVKRHGVFFSLKNNNIIDVFIFITIYFLFQYDYEYYIYITIPVILNNNKKNLLLLFRFSKKIFSNSKLIEI